MGALARVGAETVLPHQPGAFGWATLVVNALGAAVLCGLLPLIRTPAMRLPVATGLLGSFTTFSGFAVDATLLVDAGRPVLAGGYVLASLAALLTGGLLGRAVGQRAARGVVQP